jgi:hypothetical protein
MPNRTQVDNFSLENMVDPALRIINNTTVAGGAIDLQGFDSAMVVAQIGAWGDTVSGGLLEIGLQHSETTVTGDFVDVPDDELTDTVAGASTVSGAVETGVFASVSSTSNDQKVAKTAYKGGKRYLRVKFNGEKNLATGTPVAVLVAKGNPGYAPQ